jgi:DNA polymerase-3 subunit gamma/tau
MTEETAGELIETGKDFSTDTLSRYLNILQELCSSIRASSVKRITLEMALIKMMHPETGESYDAVIGRLEKLESGMTASSGSSVSDSNPSGSSASDSGSSVIASTGSNSSGGLSDVDITMLESIIDKKLDQKIDEEIKKRIKSGELALSGQENYDPEEQSKIALQNIRDSFPPAVAKDLEELATKWNEIARKLPEPYREYSDACDIEPSPNFADDGSARLRMIFDEKEKEEGVRYDFFCDPNKRSRFEELLSGIINKKVEIEVLAKKRSSGVLDRNSQALNKINFSDIKIIDTE